MTSFAIKVCSEVLEQSNTAEYKWLQKNWNYFYPPYTHFSMCFHSPPSSDPQTPGVPGPPGVIQVEEIGDTWVKLWWTKGAEHNSPILYYTIQTRHYWALYEDDWRNASTCEYCSLPAGGQLTPQIW